MTMDKDRIAKLADRDSFIISQHARIRMFERNISTDDLIRVIKSGDIIESYPDDDPCPSLLMLDFIEGQPHHVVLGMCEDHLRVITVYNPDEDQWIDARKRRGKK